MSQAAAPTARSKKPEPIGDYVNKRKIPSETGQRGMVSSVTQLQLAHIFKYYLKINMSGFNQIIINLKRFMLGAYDNALS